MKKNILMTAMLMALPLGVLAETSSFNFVEVGYTEQSNDQVGAVGDFGGFEIAGSYSLENNIYLAGKHISTSERGLDLTRTTFGVGYQFEFNDSTVLYTQIDLAAVVMGRDNAGEFEEQGYQLSFGVKTNIADAIDFQAALKYLDVGQVDATFGDFNPTYFELGVSYMFTDEFSAYIDYETESDSDRYSVGLRYSF